MSIGPSRAYLDNIGDSLVISGRQEPSKVHIAHGYPSQALTEAAKYSTLELAKINMRAGGGAGGRQAGPRAPMIWTPWRRSWRPWRRRESARRNTTASRGGVRRRRQPPPSGISGRGPRKCPAAQTMVPSTRPLEVNRTPARWCSCCPTTRTHHHSRPAVRGPDGKKGHRGAHQHRAPGISTMMAVDPEAGSPGDPWRP